MTRYQRGARGPSPAGPIDAGTRNATGRGVRRGRDDIAANYGDRDNETVIGDGDGGCGCGGGVPLNGRGPWRAPVTTCRRRRRRRLYHRQQRVHAAVAVSEDPDRRDGSGGKGQEKLLLFLRRRRHPSVSPWKQTRVNQNKLTCGPVLGRCVAAGDNV